MASIVRGEREAGRPLDRATVTQQAVQGEKLRRVILSQIGFCFAFCDSRN
jgi:hypothetical protein